MAGVFISYRRDDSRGSAGRLYDGIADRIGRASVFRDLDALAPGAEYGKDILAAIAQCSTLIAVIGPRWLEARDSAGHRRIDRPDDLVRVEIATALKERKVVIPVLVDDAEMPPEEGLPSDLAALATRNALAISDQRWDYDLGRLMAVLDGGAAPRPPAVSQTAGPVRAGRRLKPTLAVVILALIAAGVFAANTSQDDHGREEPTAGNGTTELIPTSTPGTVAGDDRLPGTEERDSDHDR